MSKQWKRGLWLGAIVLLISGLTIYCTVDVHTFASLAAFNATSLLLASVALVIGMLFDGLRLQRLVGLLGYRLSLMAVIKVIFGNYFMALLTPGATGGAVAQVLILRSYGVPILEGTPVVLIRTIFSILFLCLCLPFIFVWYPIAIPYVPQEVLLGGSVLLVLGVACGVVALRLRIVKKAVIWLATRKKGNTGKGLLQKLQQLNDGFSLLYKHPVQGSLVFLESGISLLSLYAIAPALMYAFTSDIPIGEVLCRMILLNLILYFAPTPGGTGVAEGLFIYLMDPFLPPGTVGLVAVGWRVLAEYVPFFVGMYAALTLYGGAFQMQEASEGEDSYERQK